MSTHVFMEKHGKLFLIYHEIPTLSVSLTLYPPLVQDILASHRTSWCWPQKTFLLYTDQSQLFLYCHLCQEVNFQAEIK